LGKASHSNVRSDLINGNSTQKHICSSISNPNLFPKNKQPLLTDNNNDRLAIDKLLNNNGHKMNDILPESLQMRHNANKSACETNNDYSNNHYYKKESDRKILRFKRSNTYNKYNHQVIAKKPKILNKSLKPISQQSSRRQNLLSSDFSRKKNLRIKIIEIPDQINKSSND